MFNKVLKVALNLWLQQNLSKIAVGAALKQSCVSYNDDVGRKVKLLKPAFVSNHVTCFTDITVDEKFLLVSVVNRVKKQGVQLTQL